MVIFKFIALLIKRLNKKTFFLHNSIDAHFVLSDSLGEFQLPT